MNNYHESHVLKVYIFSIIKINHNLNNSMSKRSEVKRQLFRGLSSKKGSLEASTHNLLTRTLKKQSDKYKNHNDNDDDTEKFIIHKSTSPEDYKIFSSSHPMRESKLQAFEHSEQAFEELFHRNGFMDDSGSEDEGPDLSSFAPTTEQNQDDILVSVAGYSKEEVTASKRLNIRDRKNVRLSKVSDLERAFVNHDFLRTMDQERLHEYNEMNKEFLQSLESSMEQKKTNDLLTNSFPREHDDNPQSYEELREAVAHLEETNWMFGKIN